MKYYKYQDDDGPLGAAMTYVEVDNGRAWRQITVNAIGSQASNAKYPQWGMTLIDQLVDYDSIEEVTPIDKSEFDRIWNEHLASRAVEWNETKSTYLIGKAISGYLEVFYPQGVIVDLGDDALGVADHQKCRESTRPEFMYPGHEVTAVVSGYDKANQWIMLDMPHVHEEQKRRTT